MTAPLLETVTEELDALDAFRSSSTDVQQARKLDNAKKAAPRIARLYQVLGTPALIL